MQEFFCLMSFAKPFRIRKAFFIVEFKAYES